MSEEPKLFYPIKDDYSLTATYGQNGYGNFSNNFHTGIDFGTNTGNPVYASKSGTVKVIQENYENTYPNGPITYGTYIKIGHANNFDTLYAHLSQVTVSEGQQIEAGQKIGEVGNSGYSTGSHLHFELHQGSQHRDPEPYLVKSEPKDPIGSYPPPIIEDEPLTRLPVFDPNFYLNKYPQVEENYGSNNYEGAASHWLNFGIQEGRQGSAVFDPNFYLNKYPQVEENYGNNNYRGAISHWLNFGIQEGRQGSAVFDPKYYLQANSDVREAYGANNFQAAIDHYLTYGISEGRQGSGSMEDVSNPDNGPIETAVGKSNEAPTAKDDAGNGFVTDEDNALFTGNVLDNDSDPENDFLEVTLDSSNTVGTVTEQGNGNFIYDPNNEFESLDVGETATDTFNYTINDFHGGEDTGKVTIKIYGVNDAPTAKDDAGNGFVTDEDNALFTGNVLDNDSDPENDFLEVTLDSSNTVGTVTEQGNGNFIYDPNNEFESLDVGETATDTFNYTINDFDGGEDTGKVSVKIYGVNEEDSVAGLSNDDDLIQSQTQTSASGATSVSIANQVDGDNRDVTPELSDNLYSLGSVADSQEVPESFTPAIPFPTEGANDQGLDIA